LRTACVAVLLVGTLIAGGAAEPQTRPPIALAPIYDAYAAGDVDVVQRLLRTLESLQAIRTELFETIHAVAPRVPDDPIPIAFLFEISYVGLQLGWPDAMTVLDRGRSLAQQRKANSDTADAIELAFHRAALSVLVGLQRSDAVEAYLQRVGDRVSPEGRGGLVEPRFMLAHAIAQELRTRAGVASSGKGPGFQIVLTPAEVSAINLAIKRFDTAARYAPNVAEASVRKGHLLHRLGRFDDALAAFAQADGRSDDQFVNYWCALFQGRTLDALSRTSQAEAAYRRAAGLIPDAQSPAVALAALFMRHDRRTEALEWAETARSAPFDTVDPWWRYWFGDYRFLPDFVGALRKAVR